MRPGGGGIELEVRALQDAPILSLSQLEETELEEVCAPYFFDLSGGPAHTCNCCPTSQDSNPRRVYLAPRERLRPSGLACGVQFWLFHKLNEV